MTRVDDPSSTFTNVELARLRAYRAAVSAGFYTDWAAGAARSDDDDDQVLAWLARPEVRAGGYPFTPPELARLTRTRAAVEAGYYSEQLVRAGVDGA